MYCQKCGTENLENAAMCQQCGGVFVYSQPTRTSGMAITSMILGISGFSMLGVFGITGIIGLVFGIVALSRVGKAGGQLKGKGFAITGITTSAAGLALWLTVFGVLLFYNSTKTISLHRKVAKLQNIVTAAAEGIEQKPDIEGWVYIIYDKNKPDDKAVGPLLPKGKLESGDLSKQSFAYGPAGKRPVNVDFQFIGKKDKTDVYDFAINYADGDLIVTVEKEVCYDGTEQVVFEDAQRKIYIRPEK